MKTTSCWLTAQLVKYHVNGWNVKSICLGWVKKATMGFVFQANRLPYSTNYWMKQSRSAAMKCFKHAASACATSTAFFRGPCHKNSMPNFALIRKLASIGYTSCMNSSLAAAWLMIWDWEKPFRCCLFAGPP